MSQCPLCLTEYEDRGENEPIYECIDCGAEGFDCCVPGNDSICVDCGEEELNDAAEEYDA